jgi:hypothetical protein
MRTACKWRAPALRASCLVLVAAWSLTTIDRACAQGYGSVMFTSGTEALVPQADPGPAPAGTGTGGCAACADNGGAVVAAQPCPACSGRGCLHCNGTGLFRGCDDCRKQLYKEHRGLFAHNGYWDGRHECAECPYGRDDLGRCCEPRWAVTAGAIAMQRSTARKSAIIESASGTSLVSIDDLDLEWSAGPRVSVMRRFEPFDIEFVFWGIDNWDKAAVVSADGLQVPVVGADAYTLAGVEYQSRLYNGEANGKLRIAEAINLIVGARFMELHEKFLVGAATSGTSGREVDAIADNYLTGFQLGADTDVPIWAGISFNLYIKGGVFNNRYNQRLYTQTLTNGQLVETATSLRDDCAAFAGETGVIATWQLGKNLGIYGGYQFMWLDGVVLAPDMVTGAPVRTNTPHYEGAMFGATLQW